MAARGVQKNLGEPIYLLQIHYARGLGQPEVRVFASKNGLQKAIAALKDRQGRSGAIERWDTYCVQDPDWKRIPTGGEAPQETMP